MVTSFWKILEITTWKINFHSLVIILNALFLKHTWTWTGACVVHTHVYTQIQTETRTQFYSFLRLVSCPVPFDDCTISGMKRYDFLLWGLQYANWLESILPDFLNCLCYNNSPCRVISHWNQTMGLITHSSLWGKSISFTWIKTAEQGPIWGK